MFGVERCCTERISCFSFKCAFDVLISVKTRLPFSPGGYLTRCGQVENKIGMSERRFKEKAQTEFFTPLKAFLEVDIKNVLVSCKNV